jgi:hypothetical protein
MSDSLAAPGLHFPLWKGVMAENVSQPSQLKQTNTKKSHCNVQIILRQLAAPE